MDLFHNFTLKIFYDSRHLKILFIEIRVWRRERDGRPFRAENFYLPFDSCYDESFPPRLLFRGTNSVGPSYERN